MASKKRSRQVRSEISNPGIIKKLNLESVDFSNLGIDRFQAKEWESFIGRKIILRDSALQNTEEERFAEIMWHGFIVSVDWSDIDETGSANIYVRFLGGDIEIYTNETPETTQMWVFPKCILDQENEKLTMGKFDFAVIGAGVAGLAATATLAQPGNFSIALLEARREDQGGLGGRSGWGFWVRQDRADDEESDSGKFFYPYSMYASDIPDRPNRRLMRAHANEGFALSATQPIDWTLVFWAREIFEWALISALLVPLTNLSFSGILDACIKTWLDRIEIDSLLDVEISRNFRFPAERPTVENLIHGCRKKKLGHKEDISRFLLIKGSVSRSALTALSDSLVGQDAAKVAGFVANIDETVWSEMVKKAVCQKYDHKKITMLIESVFNGQAGSMDLRSENEIAEEKSIKSASIIMIKQLLEWSEGKENDRLVCDGLVVGRGEEVAELADEVCDKEKTGEVSILCEAGVVGIDKFPGFLKIWFRRKDAFGQPKYIIARGIILAVPLNALCGISLNVMGNVFAINSDCESLKSAQEKLGKMFSCQLDNRRILFIFKGRMPWAEVPFPTAWKSPDCRGWSELKQIVYGGYNFQVLDGYRAILARVPITVPILSAKKDARSALQAIFPSAKIPEPVSVDGDLAAGTLRMRGDFDWYELEKIRTASFCDGRALLAGEMFARHPLKLGTLEGAQESGKTQALRLLEIVGKPGNFSGHVMTNVQGDAFLGRKVESNEIEDSDEEGGKSGATAIYDVKGYSQKELLRCISATSDGFRYRKDIKELKVSFPKRVRLSEALRDRQVCEAVIATEDNVAIRRFFETVRDGRKGSDFDPLPLAMNVLEVSVLDLPAIEDMMGAAPIGGNRPTIRAPERDAYWSDDPMTGTDTEDEGSKVNPSKRVSANKASYRCAIQFSNKSTWLNNRKTAAHALRDHRAVKMAIEYLSTFEQKRDFTELWKNISRVGAKPTLPNCFPPEVKRKLRQLIKRVLRDCVNQKEEV